MNLPKIHRHRWKVRNVLQFFNWFFHSGGHREASTDGLKNFEQPPFLLFTESAHNQGIIHPGDIFIIFFHEIIIYHKYLSKYLSLKFKIMFNLNYMIQDNFIFKSFGIIEENTEFNSEKISP